MLLAEDVITQATAIDIATAVLIGGLIAIVVAFQTSTKHRLDALEKAQEKDNEWRAKEFAPWRRKIDNFTNSIKLIDLLRALVNPSTNPDAAQSKTWPRTDDH